MATANFDNSGNGGINAIMDSDEVEVAEIYDMIEHELSSEGGFVLFNYQGDTAIYKNDKLVAVMALEYGYYEGVNVAIWLVADMTKEEMVYRFEDLVSDYTPEDGWLVSRRYFTRNQKEKNKVLKIVEKYTQKL